MPYDVWTPMITSNPSLRNKSLQARNKVVHVELLRSLCRDMLWLWSIETNNARNKKDFLFSEKKSKAKNKKKITRTFGKLLFLLKHRTRYTIYMPPNTKDIAINQMMVAYGNRQNATAFARANDSDLLQSLKHLMETRLNDNTKIINDLQAKESI